MSEMSFTKVMWFILFYLAAVFAIWMFYTPAIWFSHLLTPALSWIVGMGLSLIAALGVAVGGPIILGWLLNPRPRDKWGRRKESRFDLQAFFAMIGAVGTVVMILSALAPDIMKAVLIGSAVIVVLALMSLASPSGGSRVVRIILIFFE